MNYKPRHFKNTKLLPGNDRVIDRKDLTAYFSVCNIIIFPRVDTNIRFYNIAFVNPERGLVNNRVYITR